MNRRKRGPSAAAVAFAALAFLTGLGVWRSGQRSVQAANSGTVALFTVQGSGAGTANGDYVSDASALDTFYRYFIEVPPGISELKVEIFDADVGIGGTAEAAAGRDRTRNTFATSARYSLIKPSGSAVNTLFTIGNATGPVGSDNAWLTLFDSTSDTVGDIFFSASYGNNDGEINWSTNWIESNDDSSATTGLIQITGGQLRIEDNGDANASSINREANLSSFGTATFSFDFHTTNLEPTDTFMVQVSSNGGGSWTTLETFTGQFSNSSRSYDISSFASSNTRIRFITGNGFSGDDALFVDNVLIQGSNIANGHWELRVDMSSAVTSGDDINAFGIRASDGDTSSGGTELNVYADSFYPIGVNPPASGTSSRTYAMYPYITSGCTCAKNDFDYDSENGNVGAIDLTSRTGNTTQNFASASLSTNNSWRRDNVFSWTTDSDSDDYGIWTANATINSYTVASVPNGNLATLWFSNFQAAANPPTSNPANNALRIYLPNDSGTAPTKPYLLQRFVGPGTTIPVGQSAEVVIWQQVANPTSQAITFSSTNVVTVNIPGSGVVYEGNATVSQGSIITQPAIGGTGNLTWNPGTLAAGANAILIYYVKVTPGSAGQRLPITGTQASGNGTRATYVDETGNTTQSRATIQFGPLCELAVTQNTLAPTVFPPTSCSLSSLPNGTVGASYNQTVGTFTPVLIEGSLPPGLSISGTHITGTPTTAGVFDFSLADALAVFGCMVSRAYSVTISTPTASDGIVSGRIVDIDGNPVEGAGITMRGGQNRLTVTDANGYYHFDNVETDGFYTLTPSRVNFTFSPSQRSFSLLGQHTEAGFTAWRTGSTLSPLDKTEYFVRQQYVDFLGREPDEAGLSYWYNDIESCGSNQECRSARRVDTSAAFLLSIEFHETGYFVYRAFQSAYGLMPNAPVPIQLGEFIQNQGQITKGVVVNVGNWQATLSDNKRSYLRDFVQRSRFIASYPTSMSPRAFVDQLFENAGVIPDENDRTDAIRQFGSATTSEDVTARARALQMVIENLAVDQHELQKALVLMEYFGYLRRNPNDVPDVDFSGYDFWLTKLNLFNGDFRSAEMVKAFLASSEYRARFGQ